MLAVGAAEGACGVPQPVIRIYHSLILQALLSSGAGDSHGVGVDESWAEKPVGEMVQQQFEGKPE